MEESSVHAALNRVNGFVVGCNQQIDLQKPWTLAKDKTRADQLDGLLYHVAESLRIIAILISPVLPKAAHGIFDQLNWKMELSGKEERFRLEDAKWGGLPDGHVVGKPVPLFPRIELRNAATAHCRRSASSPEPALLLRAFFEGGGFALKMSERFTGEMQ